MVNGLMGLDAIYWSSAIFSRKAMAMNHVRPHKFVERRGLGVYRIFASATMFTLLVFLTVYETMMTKTRVYLTFVWWVSLLTWLFFAMASTNWRAYFGETKQELLSKSEEDSDGSHPFYDWKLITYLNCFSL